MSFTEKLTALAIEAGFPGIDDHLTFRQLARRLATVRATREATRSSERIVLCVRRAQWAH